MGSKQALIYLLNTSLQFVSIIIIRAVRYSMNPASHEFRQHGNQADAKKVGDRK
jgi:hypothetical protein